MKIQHVLITLSLLTVYACHAFDIWTGDDQHILCVLASVEKTNPTDLAGDRMCTEKLRACRERIIIPIDLRAYVANHGIDKQFCPVENGPIETYIANLADRLMIPKGGVIYFPDLAVAERKHCIKSKLQPSTSGRVCTNVDIFKTSFFQDAPWRLQRYIAALCIDYGLLHPNAPLPCIGLSVFDIAFVHKDIDMISFLFRRNAMLSSMIASNLDSIATWLVKSPHEKSAVVLKKLGLSLLFPPYSLRFLDLNDDYPIFEDIFKTFFSVLKNSIADQSKPLIKAKIDYLIYNLYERFPRLHAHLMNEKHPLGEEKTVREKWFIAYIRMKCKQQEAAFARNGFDSFRFLQTNLEFVKKIN